MALLQVIILVSFIVFSLQFSLLVPGQTVHEHIAEESAKKAGLIWNDAFVIGTRWPDFPCEEQDTIDNCPISLASALKLGAICTLPWRSHLGDKSVWHSMAPPPSSTLTNAKVRSLIIIEAETWYKKAVSTRDYNFAVFNLGRMAHMVQDSFSSSHTERNQNDEVTSFIYYGNQDGKKHASLETPSFSLRERNIVGFWKANDHTAELFKLFKEKASWLTVKAYLLNNVWKIAPGSENKKAGAAPQSTSCGEPGCAVGEFTPPSRSVKITIQNNSPRTLTFADGNAAGCWMCFDVHTRKPSTTLQKPCPSIGPGKSCTFEILGCGKLEGTNGWVKYKENGSQRVFQVKWKNPLAGYNECEICTHQCRQVTCRGNNAAFSYLWK